MTIEKIKRNLQAQNNGIEPSVEEIAKYFEGTVDSIRNIQNAVRNEHVKSIDSPIMTSSIDSNYEYALIDFVKNGQSLSLIESQFEEPDEKEKITNLVAVLPDILESLPGNERKVIELRYLSDKKYKIQDMDSILGVGIGYAYKLHKKAINRIKKELIEHTKTILPSPNE